MVKTGIVGANSPQAGELIRILINHPDIELACLYAPGFSGRSASSVHPGLIGENVGNFSDKLILDEIDLLFIAENAILSPQQMSQIDESPELKVIFMDGSDINRQPTSTDSRQLPTTGLSEINRKGLVRGATHAQLLNPIVATTLISLFPLAKYMLLNSRLQINVTIPQFTIDEFGERSKLAEKIRQLICQYYPGFSNDILIDIASESNEKRGLTVVTELDCNLSLEEIEKIYESIYDDHNFTFTTFSPVTTDEVVGTQKCVISLSKPDSSKLNVKAVADIRMRGGAGDAVHVMNLLLGLHEKTGLTLKTSNFGIINQ